MGRRRPPHILTPVKAAGLHYANAFTTRVAEPNRLLTLGPVIYFANVDHLRLTRTFKLSKRIGRGCDTTLIILRRARTTLMINRGIVIKIEVLQWVIGGNIVTLLVLFYSQEHPV